MASRRERERRTGMDYGDMDDAIDQHEAGFTPTTIKLPKKAKVYQWKKGTNNIDIIPYEYGEGNPYAKGKLWWERTYWAHKGLGPNKESHCCLRKNFGKKCSPCLYVSKLRSDPEHDKKLAQGMSPKERQLFLVIDRDDEEAGLQIAEGPFYNGLGELILTKCKKDRARDKPRGWKNFFHLDGGFSLEVYVEEDTYAGRTFLKPTDIEFVKRDEALDESLVEEAPCLDDMLVELSYKELDDLFNQTEDEDDDDDDNDDRRSSKKGKKSSRKKDDDDDDDDDDEDDPKTSKKSSKKGSAKSSGGKDNDDDDDDDDDDEPTTAKTAGIKIGMRVKHKKYGICEVIHISGDGTSLRIQDGQEEEHRAIGCDDVVIVKGSSKKDDDDDDDDDEKPSKSRKSKSKKDDDDDDGDDDDDDDDDDEDDEPKKRGSKTSKSGTKKTSSKSKKDEDDDDDDGDDDDDSIGLQDTVSFLDKKGKKVKGKVMRIDKKTDEVYISLPNQAKATIIDMDDVTLVSKAEPDDDDDDDDEPKSKRRGGTTSGKNSSKKKGKKDEDEDDDDDDDDD